MLRNVQKVLPKVIDHTQAIHWCVQRRNTTARVPTSDWTQWLPEDAMVSPFPDQTFTRSNEDHHIGEGLWLLCELVRMLNGKLWVLSGNGEYLLENGCETTRSSQLDWPGVVIEVELAIPEGDSSVNEQQTNLEDLAKRIGL